jgi:O-antigen/teichoic acid export membrane protein
MWKRMKKEFEQGKALLQFGFLQTLGYIVATLIPLAVAKLFSEELFGRYSLGEMIVFFFVTLFILSIRVPFIVFANQERAESGKIHRSFSIQCMFLGTDLVLFSIVCLVFRKQLMAFAKIDSRELLAIALAFFAMSFKDFISNLFMALNEKIKSALVELSFGIVALLVLYIFYLADWVNLKSVFLTYFISSLIVFLAYLGFVNFKMLRPVIFDKKYFSQMLNFTLWTAFAAIAVYLINWGGIAILRKYASLEDTGVFSLAYKFFKGFMALIYPIATYFLPFISENINDAAKIRTYLYYKRPRVFLLGTAGFAAAFFIIPWFINLIYGDKFQNAVPITRILLFGAIAYLYTAFYNPLIAALKKYKFAQIASITQVVLNIVLNLALIPRMGTYGAALATVIAYIYLLLVYEVYFRLKLAKMLPLVQV